MDPFAGHRKASLTTPEDQEFLAITVNYRDKTNNRMSHKELIDMISSITGTVDWKPAGLSHLAERFQSEMRWPCHWCTEENSKMIPDYSCAAAPLVCGYGIALG
jgi:hypothetical protein